MSTLASSAATVVSSFPSVRSSASRKAASHIQAKKAFFGTPLINVNRPSPSLSKANLHHRVSAPSFSFFKRLVAVSLGGLFLLAMGVTKPSWFPNFGGAAQASAATSDAASSLALGPDTDTPEPGLQFATFGAGCFWGIELAYQRVPGVVKTEVGYTQGLTHNPTYEDVCSGSTGHNECVRVQYDPKEVGYEVLLDLLWSRIDPTTPNRQGNDRGTQYRSGIYYYTPEQEQIARASVEKEQTKHSRPIVTEVLPAKKWYRAEKYHQQYLSKGGRFGTGQSAEKGCKDPIRCYG